MSRRFDNQIKNNEVHVKSYGIAVELRDYRNIAIGALSHVIAPIATFVEHDWNHCRTRPIPSGIEGESSITGFFRKSSIYSALLRKMRTALL